MEIKVKACLLLDEMKSQGNGMREVLLFLGKMLVLRKASFIGHRDYLTAVLEPDGHAVAAAGFFDEISQEYAVWPQTSAGIGVTGADLLVHSLAEQLQLMDEKELPVLFREALAEAHLKSVEILPEALFYLGQGLLEMKETERLYLGISGMGLPSDLSALQGQQICMVDCSPYWQQIWRIQEFLLYGKSACICGNPLLKPLSDAEGKDRQFERVFLSGPQDVDWTEIESELLQDTYGQYRYGWPKAGMFGLLTVEHALHVLKPEGRGIVVLLDGELFRGGKDERVRKELLAADVIEAVISLPPMGQNSLLTRDLLLLCKNKPADMKGKIQFINASRMGQPEGKGRVLSEKDVLLIRKVIQEKQEVDEFSTIAAVSGLARANLLPAQYVQHRTTQVEGLGRVSFGWTGWPEGKEFLQLKNIAVIFRGINVIRNIIESPTGKYKIINLADVQNGQLLVEHLKNYEVGSTKVDTYLVEPGDLLITARGSVTKICCVPEDIPGNVLISQNFYGLRSKGAGIASRVLQLYLESPVGCYLLEGIKSGTTLPLLDRRSLQELRIPKTLLENAEATEEIFLSGEKEAAELRRKLAESERRLKESIWESMGLRDYFHLDKEE